MTRPGKGTTRATLTRGGVGSGLRNQPRIQRNSFTTRRPPYPWEPWRSLLGGGELDAARQRQDTAAELLRLLRRQRDRDHDLVAVRAGHEVEVLEHGHAIRLAEHRDAVGPAPVASRRHLARLQLLLRHPALPLAHHRL